MAMTARNQCIIWGLVTLAFFTFVYAFKGVLLPFVLGLIIAYLLNPLVCKMVAMKIPRSAAALIILLLFFGSLALSITLAAPLLYKQGVEFTNDMPEYIAAAREMAQPFIIKASNLLGVGSGDDIKALFQAHSAPAADIVKKLIGGLLQGGQAFFGAITLIVVTPIVAYFVMKEWWHITNWGEGLLPMDHKQTIMGLIREIDKKISGFVRGQISVALILGIAYAIALTIAGLKYGFLIGLMAGFLSVIPMVGSFLGLVVSIAVAWFQAGELSYVGIIAAIFLVGQIIEGNILSPKIVGDSVGLHPLWVFFALFAGGALFGVLGMLIAVPLAAIAGVLLTYAIEQYKGSSLYKGQKRAVAPKKPIRKVKP